MTPRRGDERSSDQHFEEDAVAMVETFTNACLEEVRLPIGRYTHGSTDGRDGWREFR
jgi:hypothetical protein